MGQVSQIKSITKSVLTKELHVSIQTPIILKCLLDFLNIYVPLNEMSYTSAEIQLLT